MLDTQQFVTHGIQGQVKIVTAALQCIQMIFELLAFHLIKLEIGNKDHTTLETEAVGNAFVFERTTFTQPRNFTALA